MVEVDTIFTIKRPEALLEICKPYLHNYGIKNATELLKVISIPNKLEELCNATFEKAGDPKKVGRMKKYKLREEILLDDVTCGESIKDSVPIFVNGLSPVNYTGSPKMGLDPFSNSHLFSTLVLEHFSNYEIEFLQNVVFVYVQPITWVQKFIINNNDIGLQDLIMDKLEAKINPIINGIGFGTLTKFDDISPKIGNSKYDPGLYSVEYLRKALLTNPHNFDDEAIFDGKINYNKLIDVRKSESFFNSELTAFKYATLIDKIFPILNEKLQFFDLGGIPLYMEKTSESAKILLSSIKYSKYPINFKFVGGEKGILSSTPERIPMLGICHPSALGRLIGLIDNMYMTWNQKYSRKTINLKFSAENNTLEYNYSEKYPFLLLENGTANKHPNLEDIVDVVVTSGEFNLNDLKNVNDFAFTHRVGFSRIEPRIVDILTKDISIYNGLRRFNKENRRWFAELNDKLVTLPDEIPGFFDIPSIKELKSEFRGSEFALRTSPIIDEKWINNFEKGAIDCGCSIDKLLSGIDKGKKMTLLRESIPFAKSEDLEEFLLYHDIETLQSPAQIRGTFIHKISSQSFNDLVHYNTLIKAGLKETASDRYTETPFNFELSLNDVDFTASMHPDAYFFLKRDVNNYDVVIIDTKTNSVKPYVEHRYAQQTFFYGWLLKKIMKKDLDINIENIYCVLNKNAFYKPFDKGKIVNPHSTYRKQVYSPITLFNTTNVMHQAIPAILNKAMVEKKNLSDQDYFCEYKKSMEKIDRCKSCYKENKLVCDMLNSNRYERSSLSVLFKL